MTKRVAIIGAPSTGKTTLARGLVSMLSQEGVISEYVSEYAARYIRKYGVPQYLWEQIRIFNKQKEWEDNVPDQVQIMVTDSPLFLTAVYGPMLKRDDKGCLLLSDLFKMITKQIDRYSTVIYLPPRLNVVNDGTRTQDKGGQLDIDYRITSLLDVLCIPYNVLHGEISNWVDEAFTLIPDGVRK